MYLYLVVLLLNAVLLSKKQKLGGLLLCNLRKE